jgi:hypothetical protein
MFGSKVALCISRAGAMPIVRLARDQRRRNMTDCGFLMRLPQWRVGLSELLLSECVPFLARAHQAAPPLPGVPRRIHVSVATAEQEAFPGPSTPAPGHCWSTGLSVELLAPSVTPLPLSRFAGTCVGLLALARVRTSPGPSSEGAHQLLKVLVRKAPAASTWRALAPR